MDEEEKPKNARAPNARTVRIDLLKGMIAAAKKVDMVLSKKKICALMAIDHGVSEDKVIEYLGLFETVEAIKIEGDDIMPL